MMLASRWYMLKRRLTKLVRKVSRSTSDLLRRNALSLFYSTGKGVCAAFCTDIGLGNLEVV